MASDSISRLQAELLRTQAAQSLDNYNNAYRRLTDVFEDHCSKSACACGRRTRQALLILPTSIATLREIFADQTTVHRSDRGNSTTIGSWLEFGPESQSRSLDL